MSDDLDLLFRAESELETGVQENFHQNSFDGPQPCDADEQRRIAEAEKLVSESIPVAGTPGESYLIGRCIDPDKVPKGAVGYHENSGALVFPARNRRGDVQACQRVFLDKEGRARVKSDGHKAKRTRGVMRGAAMRLDGVGDATASPSASAPSSRSVS